MSQVSWTACILSVSCSIVGFAITSAPASAVELTPVDFFTIDESLWKVESTIGGSGKEFFLSNNGSSGVNPDSADWTWADAQAFNWRLVSQGNSASFTLFSGALDNSFSQTIIYEVGELPVNGLEITTRVDGRNNSKVAAGTTANLRLNTLNNQDISNLNIQSTALGVAGADTWDKVSVASNDFLNGFNLTGDITFDWPDFNPQLKNAGSRLQFQLEANYDPNFQDIPNSEQVPESTSLVGLCCVLLGLGVSGFATEKRFRRKQEY
ncbi:MAG: hypothetical protein F6K14_23935 [Symploca sp. SIO2C1]|nr:hypothetical protein [Symploca sp. SIO2C1]